MRLRGGRFLLCAREKRRAAKAGVVCAKQAMKLKESVANCAVQARGGWGHVKSGGAWWGGGGTVSCVDVK